MMCSCRSASSSSADSATTREAALQAEVPTFSADSAFSFVKKQVDFGPRVPNTGAHDAAAAWIESKMKQYGAQITLQRVTLPAFDGTPLRAVNILAQYKPQAKERILFIAHYDSRPWADEDPDPAKRNLPVDGANDGASGVGVLLEIARQIHSHPLPESAQGVDFLFVDAEDWGAYEIEDSWALGANYFVNNPPIAGYRPSKVILLDMVGAPGATFYKEYFSEQAAPDLTSQVWTAAAAAGYGRYFLPTVGGAVTDDHKPFIDAGIPAIDIIDYRMNPQGFDPAWHTTADGIGNISPETLKAVGQTVVQYLYTL
ncbi:MAG: M28 family peptidase [Clostridium sp.]|nr:M28 family peptidase [Prevotella sp.]MCM1428429.1 M28 family peptidase [Clostridium sp.]MCM1474894.1 M28 family peptidase [Muribaculaceae bacterium]